MITLSYAQLSSSVGTSLGRSEPITISQDRIDAFAGATEDRQWIHVDPARAVNGPFGATIGHGYLSLSLASAFLEQLLQVDGTSSVINYGVNKVRFPSPVPAGSELHATAEIIAADTGKGWTQLGIQLTMNAGGDKPACVAEVLVRYIAAEGE